MVTRELGRGGVDDAESERAVHRAMDLGVTFFDTADVYGRSEDILGRALAGRWNRVVIATKFGRTYDRASHTITGQDLSPTHLRQALEGSLRRLGTDVIDLYQLHIGHCPAEAAAALRAELELLVDEGKIRAYGWSTDRLSNIELFAVGPHCASAQIHLRITMATALGCTIREAAGRTGLSQDTVRYYERIGLIPPVGRDRNGYRRYNEDDLEWLVFVTRLRATGMPIADIATVVTLAMQGEATVPQRLRLLDAHRQAVEAQWREINGHLRLIRAKIAHYQQLGIGERV